MTGHPAGSTIDDWISGLWAGYDMNGDLTSSVPVESVVPDDAPDEVKELARAGEPRVPTFDPTLGESVNRTWEGEPRHRIVLIGDSLSHGFQSGAVFNTDLSYGAIIATSSAGSIPTGTRGTRAGAACRSTSS